MYDFDKNKVERFCSYYCETVLKKYENTNIKTPIPFYKDVKTKSKIWRWYDTNKRVTYSSLIIRGYIK